MLYRKFFNFTFILMAKQKRFTNWYWQFILFKRTNKQKQKTASDLFNYICNKTIKVSNFMDIAVYKIEGGTFMRMETSHKTVIFISIGGIP
jgi:hypothetical protein